MKIPREFAPADRCLYDFALCSRQNGWAQADTAQDPPTLGSGPTPTRLMIFSQCEGDTTFSRLRRLKNLPWNCGRSARGTGRMTMVRRGLTRDLIR